MERRTKFVDADAVLAGDPRWRARLARARCEIDALDRILVPRHRRGMDELLEADPCSRLARSVRARQARRRLDRRRSVAALIRQMAFDRSSAGMGLPRLLPSESAAERQLGNVSRGIVLA